MTLDVFVLAYTHKTFDQIRFTTPFVLAIMKLTFFLLLGVSDSFKIFKLCKQCRCNYTEDDAIADGLLGNRIKEPGSRKRGLVPCGAPLSEAHTMPYIMITTYIKELIADCGAENLKKL